MKKTILITGASRGFGKIWAETFLKRGDNVIVISRNVAQLQELADKYGQSVLVLQLDVTGRAACIAVANKAKQHFGSIDTVINNAGFTVISTVEENSKKSKRFI